MELISLFTAPTAAPSEVQVQNTSSTSIFVSWGEVPADSKNGVILSYTVTYVGPEGRTEIETVPIPSRNVTLMKLNEHTEYQITVAASTSKGLGRKSEPRKITTDQDSKYICTAPFRKEKSYFKRTSS